MSNLFGNFKEFLDSRVKNMLFMNFLLAWMIINYKVPMYLIFKDIDIEEKIKYIDNLQFSWLTDLVFPLFLSIVYIYIIPIVNLVIVKLYDTYIHSFILEHAHKKKVKRYEHTKKEEEAKHNAITFVKTDMEFQREKEKNDEQERANQIEQDRLQSAKKSTDIKQKEIALVKQENEQREKDVELKERELQHYNVISVDALHLIEKLNKIYYDEVIVNNPDLVTVNKRGNSTSKHYNNIEISKLKQKLFVDTLRKIIDDKINEKPENLI